jgi:hypothetical protein
MRRILYALALVAAFAAPAFVAGRAEAGPPIPIGVRPYYSYSPYYGYPSYGVYYPPVYAPPSAFGYYAPNYGYSYSTYYGPSNFYWYGY